MSTTATALVEEVPDVRGVNTQEKPSKGIEDEELEFITSCSPSVEMLDLADPAILQVGAACCSVKFMYSKEELIRLKESPLSMKRPDYLDTAYDNNNGIWDPERWHFDRKSSEASVENGGRNDSDNHRRRSGDPRERIRKEHDGIVLSPQRRSFNSGCYVPVRGESSRSNRSHSPLGKGEATPHIGHREISQGPSSRRIGSGRIFFDYPEKAEADNEFGYRRERRDTDRERDERYDRRSFGRETEPSTRPKGKEGSFTRNGARYDRRRISNESREEEPEWFSEGPISQHDTIELRGFDESEKAAGLLAIGGKKKMTTAQKKKAKERAINAKNVVENASLREEPPSKQEGPGARSTPTPLDGGHVEAASHSPIADKGAAGDTSDGQYKRRSVEVVEDPLFTIENMLKSDSLTMLLPNGVSLDGGDTSGSKFSRWFNRDNSSPIVSANKDDGSRRSSIPDDHHHLIKNILNDISEPIVSIPCDSDSYFAPISPAASTGGVASNPGMPQAASQPINFMEILQRGNKQHQGGPLHADLPPSLKNIEVPGKLLSVEELETRIRQGDGGSANDPSTNLRMNSTKQHNKTKEDNSAFQKLLAQMQDGHVISASNGPIPQQKTQPMSIMEMLSHSQKQEEAARLAQMMNSSVSQAHLANDLSYKMQQSQAQQRQIEAFSKLLASGIRQQQARTPPPLNDIGLAGRELLNRPEAQAILQAMHQRIPSPRELQVHTQNIMQRALIKKKLEEQQENYRKKQEMQQRGQSPGGLSPAKNVASPTQLAFTPTAVLRKMTAEKDDGSKDSAKSGDAHSKSHQGRAVTGMRNQAQQNQPGNQQQSQVQVQQQSQQQLQQSQQSQQIRQQWNAQFQQISKQPAGRPIVKNNANFQQQPQQQQQQQYDQFLYQQQRLLNQQQQQQQQQRKQNQYGGELSGQYANLQQFTSNAQQFSQLPHQLRAQHQQQQQPHPARAQQQQPGFNQQQWQQIIQHNQNFDNRQVGRGGGNDGDMSPTSNQLARWFSPDLLERARKGKLPNMPASGRAQHALSLEEIERQTAPVIHN